MIDFTRIHTPDGIHCISEQKAERYERIFDWVIDNFINSKIMLPDGTTYIKDHGIPSGSKLTSLLGTLIQLKRTIYLLLR